MAAAALRSSQRLSVLRSGSSWATTSRTPCGFRGEAVGQHETRDIETGIRRVATGGPRSRPPICFVQALAYRAAAGITPRTRFENGFSRDLPPGRPLPLRAMYR